MRDAVGVVLLLVVVVAGVFLADWLKVKMGKA